MEAKWKDTKSNYFMEFNQFIYPFYVLTIQVFTKQSNTITQI